MNINEKLSNIIKDANNAYEGIFLKDCTKEQFNIILPTIKKFGEIAYNDESNFEYSIYLTLGSSKTQYIYFYNKITWDSHNWDNSKKFLVLKASELFNNIYSIKDIELNLKKLETKLKNNSK